MAVTAAKDWRRIYIPFRAETALSEHTVRIVFHLGFQPQRVEVGGISLLNFRKNVSLAALPATPLTYNGREPDAPWRKDALDRIERFRKADLAVHVVDRRENLFRMQPSTSRCSAMPSDSVLPSQLSSWVVNIEDSETIRKYFKDYGGVDSVLKYREIVETLFNKATLENDLKIVYWNAGKNKQQSRLP